MQNVVPHRVRPVTFRRLWEPRKKIAPARPNIRGREPCFRAERPENDRRLGKNLESLQLQHDQQSRIVDTGWQTLVHIPHLSS